MAVPGQLKLLMVGAEGLDVIVTSGQQQPFYQLLVGQQRSVKGKPASSSTSPVWNTAHKFALTDEPLVLVAIKDETTRGIIAEGAIDLARCAWRQGCCKRRLRRLAAAARRTRSSASSVQLQTAVAGIRAS